MKRSELRQIIKEELNSVLKERTVYKTSEFEEIDGAVREIRDNLSVFNNEGIENVIGGYLDEIELFVEQYGTENQD